MIKISFDIEPFDSKGAMAAAMVQVNGQPSTAEMVVAIALLTAAQVLGEKKVADFLSDNYNDVMQTTADRLGEKVGMTYSKKDDKASWTDFCK